MMKCIEQAGPEREMTEALTSATMAVEAYRRWAALSDTAGTDANAALELVMEQARRLEGNAANLLLQRIRKDPGSTRPASDRSDDGGAMTEVEYKAGRFA